MAIFFIIMGIIIILIALLGFFVFFTNGNKPKDFGYACFYLILGSLTLFGGLSGPHKKVDGDLIIPHTIEKTSSGTYVTYKIDDKIKMIESDDVKIYAATNIMVRETIKLDIRGKEHSKKYRLEVK
jgi:hypothetical protein